MKLSESPNPLFDIADHRMQIKSTAPPRHPSVYLELFLGSGAATGLTCPKLVKIPVDGQADLHSVFFTTIFVNFTKIF